MAMPEFDNSSNSYFAQNENFTEHGKSQKFPALLTFMFFLLVLVWLAVFTLNLSYNIEVYKSAMDAAAELEKSLPRSEIREMETSAQVELALAIIKDFAIYFSLAALQAYFFYKTKYDKLG